MQTWCRSFAAGTMAVLLGSGLLAGVALPGGAAASAATPAQEAAGVVTIAQNALVADHLNAVVLEVTDNGKPLVSRALGVSMSGVPATTGMQFRNGAVAISYMSTLLLEYVDEHKVRLDDPVSKWLPDLPDASQVTLKMLANMTSGYADYVTDPAFVTANYENPFRAWTGPELLSYGLTRPMSFAPGTNWGYAHTNYVILGQILQKVGGQPLATLLQEKVLRPLGLTNTVASQTPAIPGPVLHAFTSERRQALGIAPSTPFYEESTFWNPSWTLAPGAVETTDIADLAATARGIGGGALLSRASYRAQTAPNLLGFGSALPGCSCGKQTNSYNYGLGIVRSGSWLLQNPLFGGYGATEAYLPARKIAIAVAVTFGPAAFDVTGSETNASDPIFRAIGSYLAPGYAPPISQGHG